MKFRVQLVDNDTEEIRGWLVEQFDSVEAARAGIQLEIDKDEESARGIAFFVIDADDIDHGPTYYDEAYKSWVISS